VKERRRYKEDGLNLKSGGEGLRNTAHLALVGCASLPEFQPSPGGKIKTPKFGTVEDQLFDSVKVGFHQFLKI
jgi:hypothetical protein